jgi:peptidoglycan/xylan/chitin deacetylase (PgdA/CDA1 family)
MTSVFVFHAVTDGDWFDSVVRLLRTRYHIVPLASLSAFYEGNKPAGDICHITVDDGDKSFYDVMFPVLKKHNVPASLFVSPMACNEQNNFWFQEIDGYCRPMLIRIAADVLGVPVELLNGFSVESVFKAMPVSAMNEVIVRYQETTRTPARVCQNVSVAELQEMAASGLVSVGAHTVTHPILMNETDTACQYEIGASVRTLSRMLGSQVMAFAYPNGIAGMDFGIREEQVLRANGIGMAFTTESRHVSIGDNTLRIPRLGISDKESMLSIRAKICLGSCWARMKRMVAAGEFVERRRLKCALSAYRKHRQPTSGPPVIQPDVNGS